MRHARVRKPSYCKKHLKCGTKGGISLTMENIESSDKKVRRKRQIKRNRMIILRSAKELFHKKGFYTTTMEDIAQYSGFDRRTIYNHFKNKEEIFAALVSGVIADIKSAYDEVAALTISPLERLRELVLILLDLYIENAHLLNVFTSEFEISDNRKKRYISSFMNKNIRDYMDIEARLVDMIKEAQDQELLIDVHPYILAGLLNELILRSVIVLHHFKKNFTKEDIIRDILRVIEGNMLRAPLDREQA
ncbi:MAG: TetR/AcrR family transcriptional regulator [Syntrophaceae bacterium]